MSGPVLPAGPTPPPVILAGMAPGFPYQDLNGFLTALERAGELRRVTAPVDPSLEISEITQRVVRQQGPALLFERPTRGNMPVAINLFGTDRRMCLALGVTRLDEIGDRIGSLVKPELPVGWSGIREGFGKLLQLKNVPPKRVRSAPCQEVVHKGDEVNLDRLPGLQTWPGDGGVFHNYGLTHTRHPETGKRNLGLYRLQQHSRNTLGMHWQIHKDSNAHHAVAERLGQRLPVAIAFGADPVVSYAASAPLPPDIDEYLFAGFLRGERVEMAECLTVPLQVPAHAQVVLEGHVEPGERHPEGPFGDHTGFYTPVEQFPVLHVECVTMRRKPIYHSIITSKPPQEDGPIGKATERIFLPLLRMMVPDIVDYDMPEPGVFHNCVIVSIRKRYPKHAQKVMHALWGAGLMSLVKLIVVVDEDCDVHDYNEVAWRAFGNVDYSRDMLLTEGPVDHLDHASYQQFFGGKIGIDATRKLPGEGYTRGWPEEAVMSPEVVARVDRRWKEYGLG
jgi:4-hydroxy-3-polyprenylbenzoate decarboxylase